MTHNLKVIVHVCRERPVKLIPCMCVLSVKLLKICFRLLSYILDLLYLLFFLSSSLCKYTYYIGFMLNSVRLNIIAMHDNPEIELLLFWHTTAVYIRTEQHSIIDSPFFNDFPVKIHRAKKHICITLRPAKENHIFLLDGIFFSVWRLRESHQINRCFLLCPRKTHN